MRPGRPPGAEGLKTGCPRLFLSTNEKSKPESLLFQVFINIQI